MPDQGSPTDKVVYLMRGLPCCGKSHTARKLAGKAGVICETDEYFHTHVGTDPNKYDWREELLPLARQWNFERFKQAVLDGRFPVIVDRGNGVNRESQQYARFALDNGYRVELCEPDSPWWQKIRVLLKYKRVTRPILHSWAKKLAEMSRAHHRVPETRIRQRMDGWRCNVTVDDIVNYQPSNDEMDNSPSRTRDD